MMREAIRELEEKVRRTQAVQGLLRGMLLKEG